VSDILKLARAGGARIRLDVLEIGILDAVSPVYEMFRLRFSERGIRVELSGIDDRARVAADPHKLAQVLHNLFENALQYTPRGGILQVTVEDAGGMVKMVFANTARGFQDEDLPLLFERFYRGEKSRSRAYGGAGIGLAVVKDLVEAHRGRVGAEAVPDALRIWFTLPGVPE
jgi:signal transduction histidine kinase